MWCFCTVLHKTPGFCFCCLSDVERREFQTLTMELRKRVRLDQSNKSSMRLDGHRESHTRSCTLISSFAPQTPANQVCPMNTSHMIVPIKWLTLNVQELDNIKSRALQDTIVNSTLLEEGKEQMLERERKPQVVRNLESSFEGVENRVS